MRSLGVIGCGDVAFRTYLPGILAESARATVTAAFDSAPERADRVAALVPGATPYSVFGPFLQHPGLEGIFNLTPAPMHAEITSRAFDQSLHVFSEKPLAASVAEGQALTAKAKSTGLIYLCAPVTMAIDCFQ